MYKRQTIANRNRDKAEAIATLIRDNTKSDATTIEWAGDLAVPDGIDVVINATSIGLGDAQAMPKIDPDSFRPHHVVADVIPNPPMTKLLREAKARGCTTLDGLGMLVNQGVIGVELWLDRKPSADVMVQTLQHIFNVSD